MIICNINYLLFFNTFIYVISAYWLVIVFQSCLNYKWGDKVEKYVCEVCGYIYDPELGDPDGGIPPNVDFDDLPDYWVCPICSFNKDNFSIQE